MRWEGEGLLIWQYFVHVLYMYLYTHIAQDVPINVKLLADLTESLLAAILLDKGVAFVGKFCEVCLFPQLLQTTQVCCQPAACTNHG